MHTLASSIVYSDLFRISLHLLPTFYGVHGGTSVSLARYGVFDDVSSPKVRRHIKSFISAGTRITLSKPSDSVMKSYTTSLNLLPIVI